MTAQIPEVLILDGEHHRMTLCPELPPDESMLNLDIRRERLPDSQYYTSHWTDADGVKHSEEEHGILFSTACWRRYQGTWEIKDGRFYLVWLAGAVRLAKPGPLLADWFTGVLRVPQGDQLVYVHMGFGTVYEQELHIMVERGVVKGRRVYDNTGKEHDAGLLTVLNLPGLENGFPGNSDFN